MSTITISATQLKNETADILNQVIFKGTVAVVSKYGKPLVKIIRVEESETVSPNYETLLSNFYGKVNDFPNTHDLRDFREKDLIVEE